ncbi:MAG: hypothetical protein O3B13_21675 [Planctomycetota bacterium]|nr:hypothetical protein [Planctomycetota bacterium]
MIRTAFFTCLTVVSLCLTSASVQAHENPVEAAARCMERVEHLVNRCENAASEETQQCVHEIRRLKADGQYETAIQVARECVSSSRRRTRICIGEVREICTRCVDYLLQFGAEELAARVRSHCRAAVDQLETIQQRVENAIQEALNC